MAADFKFVHSFVDEDGNLFRVRTAKDRRPAAEPEPTTRASASLPVVAPPKPPLPVMTLASLSEHIATTRGIPLDLAARDADAIVQRAVSGPKRTLASAGALPEMDEFQLADHIAARTGLPLVRALEAADALARQARRRSKRSPVERVLSLATAFVARGLSRGHAFARPVQTI